ncbi:MAG: hypothetical protein EHM59_10430 [Betaproteobacteria bacterium]|nr:MAG: hypothetical protein EHM59_10430 [Betaproteobacteria bacterium]
MYGGGFEIATVVDGRVTKAGGITYYLLDALRMENGRCIARFRRAISYEYDGDLLFVSTLELQWRCQWVDEGEVRELEMDGEIRGERGTYVIPPVHREIGEEERRRLERRRLGPSFKSLYTVLYVHLPQRGGSVWSIVHYAGPAKPAIGFDLEEREGVVTIQKELLNKIARHL